MRKNPLGTMAILGLTLSAFERPKTAKFSFDRNASGMRLLNHLSRHLDVVVEVSRCLSVFLKRPVHHDAREAIVDRTGTGGG